MRNDRLSALLDEQRLTFADIALRIDVDAKTVERWVYTGRAPHRANQQRLAAALDVDVSYIFPTGKNKESTDIFTKSEVVDVHPSRSSIDGQFMADRIDAAQSKIDILAYGGSFLHDSVPNFAQRLKDRAAGGVTIRLLFGDPESPAVELRGREEGIGDFLAGRCRHTWTMVASLLDVPGVSAAKHGETLYNSIFRFDELMFVNTHILGSPAGDNPILELRRRKRGELFDRYVESFETTWNSAEQVPSSDSGD